MVTKPVEIFKVQISSLKGDFLHKTDVTLVNKKQLLSLENPHYQQVLERYHHLKGVMMDDMDTTEFLPVHLILGVCDYTKIKTETASLLGATNKPIAEKTKFGWTIISPNASARAHSGTPSLNECLNLGLPLRNKLWGVLVRSRFHPVAVTGNIKQGFLSLSPNQRARP